MGTRRKREIEAMPPPAPLMVPAGATQWEEYVLRRILPDGRIIDGEPTRVEVAQFGIQLAAMAVPPGSRVMVLRREVTTHATDWAEVDPNAPPDGETMTDIATAYLSSPAVQSTIRAMEREAFGDDHQPAEAPNPNQVHPGAYTEVESSPGGRARYWQAPCLTTSQVDDLFAAGWGVVAVGGPIVLPGDSVEGPVIVSWLPTVHTDPDRSECECRACTIRRRRQHLAARVFEVAPEVVVATAPDADEDAAGKAT